MSGLEMSAYVSVLVIVFSIIAITKVGWKQFFKNFW